MWIHFENNPTKCQSLCSWRPANAIASSFRRCFFFLLPTIQLRVNATHQVFVYSRQNYQQIKERLKTRGVAALSRLDLYNYFAPWYAEHLGQIRAASGNTTVEQWAQRKLRLSYYIFTYVSLLKLHGNGNLLRQLDNILGNEAILSLDLKALTPLFKEPKKREWFQEIVDNYLKLWEINMW